MSKTHVFKTQHKNAPNDAAHRCLVMNPFDCDKLCEAAGVDQACCRIPDPFQFRSTKLLKTETQDTITCDASGNAFFTITPSIRFMGASTMTALPFSGGATSLANAQWPTLLANYGQYRTVAMGLEISPVSSLMNIQGTIGLANLPGLPFPGDTYPTYYMPTTLAQVQALDHSLVFPANQSGHVAWIPDANICTFLSAVSNTSQSLSHWRYSDWMAIGYGTTGAKVTTIANMNDGYAMAQGTGGAFPQLQMMYSVPRISCVINGAPANGVFNINIVQWLELTPLVRGTGVDAGALGHNPIPHKGLVASVEGEIKKGWHELGKVAGIGKTVLSDGWTVAKDVAKVGGLIASGLALF